MALRGVDFSKELSREKRSSTKDYTSMLLNQPKLDNRLDPR